jgi:hypothetical protein
MTDTPGDPTEEDRQIPIPVAPMPPENLVEKTVERAASKVADAVAVKSGAHVHPVGMGLLIANIILVGALFFVRASDRRTILHSEQIVRSGVGCLLADLDDHRHTNQGAHDTIADKLGTKVVQPDIIPLNKEQAQVLKGLCDEFVKSGTSSLQHFSKKGEVGPNEASPEPRPAQDGP